MAGSAWLDIERIKGAIRTGSEDALDEIGDRIAAEARQRAPIRKVFKERTGFRRKFRGLTEDERSQAIQRANDFYTNVRPDEFARRRAVAHLNYYAKVQLPRRGSANALGVSRKLRHIGILASRRFTGIGGTTANRSGGFEPGPALKQALTSRGRYEVRSGRAIHVAVTAGGAKANVQIGGALKASIGNEGVTETPNGVKVSVVAAIRYAKFVEFPTIRNAAQPFLLPALHGERDRVPREVAAKIRQQLRGG